MSLVVVEKANILIILLNRSRCVFIINLSVCNFSFGTPNWNVHIFERGINSCLCVKLFLKIGRILAN